MCKVSKPGGYFMRKNSDPNTRCPCSYIPQPSTSSFGSVPLSRFSIQNSFLVLDALVLMTKKNVSWSVKHISRSVEAVPPYPSLSHPSNWHFWFHSLWHSVSVITSDSFIIVLGQTISRGFLFRLEGFSWSTLYNLSASLQFHHVQACDTTSGANWFLMKCGPGYGSNLQHVERQRPSEWHWAGGLSFGVERGSLN